MTEPVGLVHSCPAPRMAGPVAGGRLDYHRQPGLPKGLRVITDCCRASFACAPLESRSSPADEIDWSELLILSRRHRVQGLVARGLERLGIEPPAAVRTTIRQEARQVVEDNLRAADECARLADRFATGGIDRLVVKGLPLSALAYGDPFVKMSADIDLLIDEANLDAAGRLLRECGYRTVLPGRSSLRGWHRLHKESVWQREGRIVELHHRLADNPRLLRSVGIDSPRQAVEIAPGLVVDTLAMRPMLAYLAVHGASSLWFRVKWISDFAALAAPADDAERDRLARFASDAGAGRAMRFALLLSDQLFGRSEVPRTVTHSWVERGLVRLALRELADPREPTATRFGTVAIRLSQLVVGSGPRFAASEILRQLRAMRLRS